ncbi:MAG: Holliday junction branch migration protein RuvA [Firmicutes bacterium]|nr:Holliday junction branch migration protein RuvA [Bacillota bacterium]
MIAALTGKILRKGSGEVVIDVGGVGYRVLVSDRLFTGLPPVGAQISLYTLLIVREDAHLLYGFETWEEREVFSTLIGVSGVGPKIALGVLSQLSLDELAQALVTGNVDLLTSVNGIGKKTAQRLIVELKDKLSLPKAVSKADQTGFATASGSLLSEVVEALVSLGYTQLDAARASQAALRELGADARLEDLIKVALKHCTNLEV